MDMLLMWLLVVMMVFVGEGSIGDTDSADIYDDKLIF